MNVGLRVDVDTFRGTRDGVPRLVELLGRHAIRATFFFSVGPDNMGRNLWRLLRPSFFLKMARSRAASLYGWDILFKGTFWPGPRIGRRLAPVIRAAAAAGHEAGLHAWDHHRWQTRLDRLAVAQVQRELQRGHAELAAILGAPPACSAAPAWKCNDPALLGKDALPFRYNSDCRGHSIFRPVVDGRTLRQPQVPTTLPTYDEVIGRHGITQANYNDHLLGLIPREGFATLTIHAEAEGGVCADLFAEFLDKARARDLQFVPLSTLVAARDDWPAQPMVARMIPGREGWVACQGE